MRTLNQQSTAFKERQRHDGFPGELLITQRNSVSPYQTLQKAGEN